MIFKKLLLYSRITPFITQRLYNHSYRHFGHHPKPITNFEIINRDGIYITATNELGNLRRILDILAEYRIITTQIETKILDKDQKSGSQKIRFKINFEGMVKDQNIQACINELKAHYTVSIDESIPIVPWFPRTLDDIDSCINLLIRNEKVADDCPTYKDPEYKKRREYIGELSKGFSIRDPIPYLEYTPTETKTWTHIYERIRPLHRKYMIKQFNENLDKLAKLKIIIPERIPQLRDLNKYLWNETGFRLKPVHGILSQREFLNALAHKVFCCTQYIRHHASPATSPEPDIIHEFLGHMAMFVYKDSAELSQQIGLYSLGATEDQILKLGALYLYTVEFGACKENGDIKGYGAGIAGSMSELVHFGQRKSEFRKLDPHNDLPLDFPLQKAQPVYFVSETYKDATETLKKYGESLQKPFRTSYCNLTNQVKITNNIRTLIPEELIITKSNEDRNNTSFEAMI